MLVCLLRRHLEEERLNPAARAGGCAGLCMFGTRERRAPRAFPGYSCMLMRRRSANSICESKQFRDVFSTSAMISDRSKLAASADR